MLYFYDILNIAGFFFFFFFFFLGGGWGGGNSVCSHSLGPLGGGRGEGLLDEFLMVR